MPIYINFVLKKTAPPKVSAGRYSLFILFIYFFMWSVYFFTGSQVRSTPSFLKILRSTSLSITVVCT